MIEHSAKRPTVEMPSYARKILTLDQLRTTLAGLRGGLEPNRIVLCHGCFDIVHPGHIRYLQFAARQGDVLVVSITGDASISKGDQRPYIPQELRAENLAALELVDYVVIDPNPTACSLIEMIRPDVYVKGGEYATSGDPRFLAERQVVEAGGGRVIFSSGEVVFSSTRLGEALSRDEGLAPHALTAVCRRHGIDRARLARILGDIAGRRVVILGDTVVERYVLCDATDVASESPMMSLAELDQHDYLGGAASIAMQAAALGAEPVLVTGLGEDAGDDWVLPVLAEAGVEVRGVRHRRRLVRKTRFLVDEHKLLRLDRAPVSPLDSVGERRAADIVCDAGESADAIVLFDSGYGMITPGVLRGMMPSIRRRGPIMTGGADDVRGNYRALHDLDLIAVSERKLRTGIKDFSGGLSSLAYDMLQETQARRLVVTLGKRGVVTFDRPTHDRASADWAGRLCSEHLPSFASQTIDRLGCGASFLTTVTLSLACGASLMQSAYMGTIAAAAAISRLGGVAVTLDEMHRAIGLRPELFDVRHSRPEDGNVAETEATAYERKAV